MKLVPRKNTPHGGQGGEIVPLRDAMTRLFDESLWDPFGLMNAHPLFKTAGRRLAIPSVDVSETSGEITVEADVPGFAPNEIEVELDENMLVLRGKKQEEREEDDKTYHLRERSESSWERRIGLPRHVDFDKIECEASNGKLTVHVPKSQNTRYASLTSHEISAAIPA